MAPSYRRRATGPLPALRPQPVSDDFVTDAQGTGRAARVGRWFPDREQRPPRDTDRRDRQPDAEVQRQSGAAGMVAAGGVDDEHLRLHGGTADRRLPERGPAPRAQTGGGGGRGSG